MGGLSGGEKVSAPRVYIPPQQWSGRESAWITGQDAKHLTKVLRLRVGAEVILLDGTGKAYRALVRSLDKSGLSAQVVEELQTPTASAVQVHLIQGLAKGDRMDTVIQKATEVGVASIRPVTSQRTIVQLERHKAARRRERWQRIAIEAAEQCWQPRIPMVHPVTALETIVSGLSPDVLGLFFWEEEQARGLREVLRTREAAPELYVFIGPEGGFTEAEAAMVQEAGAVSVSLGPRLLRTDTAGPLAAALVLYEWGDLGHPPNVGFDKVQV